MGRINAQMVKEEAKRKKLTSTDCDMLSEAAPGSSGMRDGEAGIAVGEIAEGDTEAEGTTGLEIGETSAAEGEGEGEGEKQTELLAFTTAIDFIKGWMLQ